MRNFTLSHVVRYGKGGGVITRERENRKKLHCVQINGMQCPSTGQTTTSTLRNKRFFLIIFKDLILSQPVLGSIPRRGALDIES
jgi:hypothetical protein